MNVDGKHYRTIWLDPDDPTVVRIIDQRFLPYRFVVEDLRTVDEVAAAIAGMHVRGAGLIGAAAGFGMYLAALNAPRQSVGAFTAAVGAAGSRLERTRPTAVNLAWAVDRQLAAMAATQADTGARIDAARRGAVAIANEDADRCRRIGEHGLRLVESIARGKAGSPVNVLTHCNAGWLAFVDYGSATAPIYAAHDRGLPVHVWVDETRPRNQGARLTAWELGQQGVPHTVIVDNAGGHLMQRGMVDLVITGSDRTTRAGDVANKIGTYLKALAAHDNGVPFYVALPSSTIDWRARDSRVEIPIEQRDPDEVRFAEGLRGSEIATVLLTPAGTPAANYAFDVTPARLITGLLTERGVCSATQDGLLDLYPEMEAATIGS